MAKAAAKVEPKKAAPVTTTAKVAPKADPKAAAAKPATPAAKPATPAAKPATPAAKPAVKATVAQSIKEDSEETMSEEDKE